MILNYFKKIYKHIRQNTHVYIILFIILVNTVFILNSHSKLDDEVKRYNLVKHHIDTDSSKLTYIQLTVKDLANDEKNVAIKRNISFSLEEIIKEHSMFTNLYAKTIKTTKGKELINQVILLKNQLESIYKEFQNTNSDLKHIKILDDRLDKLRERITLLHNNVNMFIEQEFNEKSNNFLLSILIFLALNILVIVLSIYYKYTNNKLLEVIKKSEERFQYAIKATRDGIWDWDIKTNEVYYSPRWKEILGYKDNELTDVFETWTNLIHPDDAKHIMQDIYYHHKTKIPYENIYRLKHKDGYWIWIKDHAYTFFDENNQAIRMIGSSADITEQKKTEDKFIASKQQFEDFMEHVPGMVSIRDGNHISYANSAVSNFIGIKNIVGAVVGEHIPKQNIEAMETLAAEVEKYGNAEAILEHIDSENRYYVFKAMMFKIGEGERSQVGTMYFDITNQYKDQLELAKFKQILESSPVSIVITDINGNIEYANPWSCKLTKYSLEELIGKNQRIFKSDYHTDEDYKNLWDDISHGKVWSGTFKNMNKNGDEYWESAIIAPVKNEADEIINYIGIKQEITEQIHLREQLKDREEIIIAQSRHAAMGEMIGMIAHQWRQPLSVIAMGANNLLIDIDLDEVSTDSINEEAQSIVKQTEYLSRTIDDFRNFFRPDKEVEEVELVDIFNNAKKIVGKSLEHNQVKLFITHEKHSKVNTYSRELLQVFINILKNAEEVLIDKREENRKIEVNVTSDDEYITIKICDNGGGIDSLVMSKIFIPYFSTKDKKTATGLGLYMSKTIIEKHLKGTIEVYNSDCGACFKIDIPVKFKE
ncbi:MAG: PAS domain S-box-containing protein [Sulfurimonas sp.]|jgi:PAS domain S-box-containing protein